MSDTPDVLADLLPLLGQGWSRQLPDTLSRSEPGAVLRLTVTAAADGTLNVRTEVRPVVGWGWYVLPPLAAILMVQAGASAVRASLVAIVLLVGTRLVVGRLLLRGRLAARSLRLAEEVKAAMARLSDGA